MDAARLRAAFPVLRERAYLNAGTCGPMPLASANAAKDATELAVAEGRTTGYFDRMGQLRERLRAAYAGVLRADPADVAIASSASEAMGRVLAGLDLRAGDEVVSAPDEHPGLLGPLAALRERTGVELRFVPLAEVADAIGPRTKLVACSHVSWTTGALAPDALRDVDVPVLLDGAQGAGAIDVDVEALGCDFYAAAGQKWLCGPIGTGLLWVSPAWRERLHAFAPTYGSFADAGAGTLRPDAGRHDTAAVSLASFASGLAAHDVLAEAGWEAVWTRAATLATQLADALAARGIEVRSRDATTLVTWRSTAADPAAEVERLAAAGIVIRSLPGTPDLRASVGAWNDEDDLSRLLAAL